MADETEEVTYNDMVIGISNLATALDTRNEIDSARLILDERREIREFRFKIILLIGVLILAGVEVSKLAGLIGTG